MAGGPFSDCSVGGRLLHHDLGHLVVALVCPSSWQSPWQFSPSGASPALSKFKRYHVADVPSQFISIRQRILALAVARAAVSGYAVGPSTTPGNTVCSGCGGSLHT